MQVPARRNSCDCDNQRHAVGSKVLRSLFAKLQHSKSSVDVRPPLTETVGNAKNLPHRYHGDSMCVDATGDATGRRPSLSGYVSDVLGDKPALVGALVHHHEIGNFEDRYDLSGSRELGSGSCGVVCTARRRDSGEEFAMKVVEANSLDAMASLRKEIELHRKLDHPNIAKIIESFEDVRCGRFFIIMELCTGGQLVSRMKHHRYGYDEATASTLMEKMLSAVLYCHHHGVVHRDIKLDNMLYEDDREEAELKLIDFGFASGVAPGQESMTDHLGTPSYMAPELWSGKETPYDSSVDMWALGAVAYMLISGTRPFHHDDKREKARMIRKDALPFHQKYWEHTSQDAKDFCSALMQKRAKDRLSASEAIKHPWITSRSRAHSDAQTAARVLRSNSDVVDALTAYSDAGAMKRLALEVIAFVTPPSRLEGLRHIFQTMDVDDSGTIDRREFTDAMALCTSISAGKLDRIFLAIDVNDSGEIDYTEFLGATVSTHFSDVVCHGTKAAFTMLDDDADGFITRADLNCTLKGHLSQQSLDSVMTCADADGRVSYSTFKETVLGVCAPPSATLMERPSAWAPPVSAA